MPDPIDRFTQAYGQIYCLLNDSAEFVAAVKVGNQVRRDTPKPGPFKVSKADADLPETDLRVGDMVMNIVPAKVSFGMLSPGQCPNLGLREVSVLYLLDVTHRDARLDNTVNTVGMNALKSIIFKALAAGGVTLGLTFARLDKPITTSERTMTNRKPGEAAGGAGQSRVVTTFRIPLVIKL